MAEDPTNIEEQEPGMRSRTEEPEVEGHLKNRPAPEHLGAERSGSDEDDGPEVEGHLKNRP
jgi:hypothetical protein